MYQIYGNVDVTKKDILNALSTFEVSMFGMGDLDIQALDAKEFFIEVNHKGEVFELEENELPDVLKEKVEQYGLKNVVFKKVRDVDVSFHRTVTRNQIGIYRCLSSD